MLPDKYRISLKRDDLTWYAVASGTVVTQPDPYYIQDPEGWDEISVTNAKNPDRLGLDRDYTVPYQFVGDGAQILRHIDYTEGPEGVCQLIIEEQDTDTTIFYPFTPKPLDLDFSAGKDQRDYYVIPIKEAGLPAMIRSYIDTEYEVPVAAHPNVRTIDVEPLVAQAELKWVTEFLASSYPTPNPNSDGHISDNYDRMLYLIGVKKTFVPTSTGGDYSPVQMGLLSTANSISLGTPEGQYPTPRNPTTGYFNSNLTTLFPYLFKAKVAISDLIVKGQFEVILKNSSGGPLTLNFRLAKQVTTGGPVVYTTLWTGTTHSVANGNTITFTEDIAAAVASVNVGDMVFLYYTVNSNSAIGGSGFDITIEQGRYITALFRYRTEAFSFDAIPGIDVFNSLIEQITGGQYTAASDLLTSTVPILDSVPANVMWTSGWAIRSQATFPNPVSYPTVIKITLAEFLKTYNVLYSAGMSTEGGIPRIERAGYFFDENTLIANLGEPANCSIEKATNYMYNKVSVGWPNQTYDEVNGLDEFNTTQIRNLHNIRTPRELNLVSSVRADMWGIFFEWVKYVLEETKDSKSDNDTFIIEVHGTPLGNGHYAPVTGSDEVSVAGLIDPDNSFNIRLSPTRCFLRNGGIIRPGMYGQDGKSITFQTTDKNQALEADTGSGLIIETSDIVVGGLDAPLFQPYIFTLDAVASSNLLALLDSSPNGVFGFTWCGNYWEGFPLEVSISPAKPKEGQLRLLSSPVNDLTLLG